MSLRTLHSCITDDFRYPKESHNIFIAEEYCETPFVKITYINARSGFPEPICLVNQIAKNLSVME